ncbi:site-specific integrase [Terriglobus aquaticus]|uniref:Site-specific integrase n=1 Tax=Terriglobus aquaticus TaxID=940139 RepID=A0ABW9KGN7_9BACT|nr:site-specific integrase [Terriglobus aquaticus]
MTLETAGHSKRYIAERASSILVVEEAVRPGLEGRIGKREIASALTQRRSGAGAGARKEFSAAARSWFRFLGLYTEGRSGERPSAALLSAFEAALLSEGRYSPVTVRSSLPPIAAFLDWSDRQGNCLDEITPNHVQDFLAAQTLAGWSRRTVANAGRSLRMFFCFAERRGWSKTGLSRTIQTGPVLRRGTSPSGPPWKEVRRMLKALDPSVPSECRARAILFLASIYGLRRCELARLKLDDFDWGQGTLTIRRAKRGRVQTFPIQPEVGDAIIRYLREVRPHTNHRHVFLTLHRPHRPAENLGPSMRKVMRATGAFQRDWGLHALRHACATELLRRGTSLQGIALFLGHRDLSSVSIYARSDERALRRVADFDLSGLV